MNKRHYFMITTKAHFKFLLICLLLFISYSQSYAIENTTNTKSDYFEIPRNYLNKQLQLINQITGYPNKLYHYGSSGMYVDFSVILRFELDNNEYIKVIQEQFENYTPENDIIKTSVLNNHFNPTICYIPIIEMNKDNIKIDVNIFKNNIPLFSPINKSVIDKYKLKPITTKPIDVNKIKLCKNSIQVTRTLNYWGEKRPKGHYTDNISVEQLLTFRILPEDKMKPRKWDARVGNFYLTRKKYSSEGYFIKEEKFQEIWRLEPQDTTAYFKGELSCPKKPIIFYMGESVPNKWRKYIKQGVLSWLPVFEKIGFKDAIEVYDKPADADWDDNNPNYNTIHWVSSEIKDAQGSILSDPRTGEILNAQLLFYQNLLATQNSDYFVNTAAVNHSVRVPILPDSIHGKIMQETMAHEMGHALALGHNMIASDSYPTDSLRSKSFVDKHSICSSIMDYASYNYIAQPEDMPVQLMRKIGPYDYWAIEYAYKYIRPSSNQYEMTIPFTNNAISKKLENPYFHYMEQEYVDLMDPTNNTGVLGDNPFLSCEYAIKNLKRIMPHLVEWSMPEDGDPSILMARYQELVNHLDYVLRPIQDLIGGRNNRYVRSEFILETTDIQQNDEVINFLSKHLFSNMKWLYNAKLEEISNKKLYLESLEKLQHYAINRMLYKNRILRSMEYDIKNKTTQSFEMLRKLSHLILKNSKREDIPLATQKKYVDNIKQLIEQTKTSFLTNQLLKQELNYVRKITKERSQHEKDQLMSAFYLDLSKS